MNEKTITLSVIQQKITNNQQENYNNTRDAIKKAKKQGANLILLSELHSNLYFCQNELIKNFELSESIPGPTSNFLAQCAKEYEIIIVGSVFERRQPDLYHNTALVFEKNGVLAGKYRKMHIPHDPGYYEKYYFTPGDLGFNPIKTSIGNLGILICWDQWFPEAARIMALNGADILLYPTAIGWDLEDPPQEQQAQLNKWLLIQRSHAIANVLPVASCNRIGLEISQESPEKSQTFWGNSFICDQQGEIIAQAKNNNETFELITAKINTNKTEYYRKIWPFFRDRRVDAYQELLRLGKH